MAKCRQSISSMLPGLLAGILIIVILLSALFALWSFSLTNFDLQFLFSYELWRIFVFTIMQSALSVVLSIFFALIFAKIIYPLAFPGKQFLLRFYAVTFALPALVLIIGLPQIYGRHGWLARLYEWLGFEYTFSIYGLSGILLAHVFYNMPFAFRLFYQSLDSIAVEQRQLSAQLGLSYWQNFRYLEFPVLYRQLLPTAALIFMLCFASFVIVLTLGGGPKNTTFEVAIYQSLRDFELAKVIILSLIQLLFCFNLMLYLRRLTPNIVPIASFSDNRFFMPIKNTQKIIGYSLVFVATLYILSPMISLFINGIAAFSWKLLFNHNLLMATMTSLVVAVGSGIIALLFGILLLWTNSRLQLFGYYFFSDKLMLIGSLVLAIPSMVLASGFFLLFYGSENHFSIMMILIMLSNGLMALPFVLKTLENPMKDIANRYNLLTNSLNIKGINRFYLIEFRALRPLYVFAFSLACVMSLGDFGIIALFGSQDFITLPFYLYQQLDSYRSESANFTALILLILCVGIFYFTESLTKHHDRT